MNEHWLFLDEKEELINSLAMLELVLDQVGKDIAAWKWAVIATHSALQNSFVCHFRSLGNNFLIAKKKDAKAWLTAYTSGATYPEMTMDSFLNLYHKLKHNEVLGFKFVPHGNQERNIKRINEYRNNFIHFFPKSWLIEISGFPNICEDCLDVIQELNKHTLHWQFQDDQQSLLSALLNSCLEQLKRLKLEYNS